MLCADITNSSRRQNPKESKDSEEWQWVDKREIGVESVCSLPSSIEDSSNEETTSLCSHTVSDRRWSTISEGPSWAAASAYPLSPEVRRATRARLSSALAASRTPKTVPGKGCRRSFSGPALSRGLSSREEDGENRDKPPGERVGEILEHLNAPSSTPSPPQTDHITTSHTDTHSPHPRTPPSTNEKWLAMIAVSSGWDEKLRDLVMKEANITTPPPTSPVPSSPISSATTTQHHHHRRLSLSMHRRAPSKHYRPDPRCISHSSSLSSSRAPSPALFDTSASSRRVSVGEVSAIALGFEQGLRDIVMEATSQDAWKDLIVEAGLAAQRRRNVRKVPNFAEGLNEMYRMQEGVAGDESRGPCEEEEEAGEVCLSAYEPARHSNPSAAESSEESASDASLGSSRSKPRRMPTLKSFAATHWQRRTVSVLKDGVETTVSRLERADVALCR
ncbi:hypothetical protein HK104_003416 [Borealophlyctis nickersoniae]|nr:hypothetical protein HK104_003416 [Borealophlyctis nickersoniae]